jgi:membrane protein DedA with SNARE-associated domain
MLFAGALASGALAHHAGLFGTQLSDGLPAYVAVALAGTLGSLVGALAGWWIGRRGGRPLVERYGRWLHLGPQRMADAERWFARFGARAVFLGRLTPLVRSFVSIPAGVLQQPLPSYVVSTLSASAIWCFGFAAAGWALGTRYENLHHQLRYLDYAAALALVVGAVLVARAWVRAGGRQPV